VSCRRYIARNLRRTNRLSPRETRLHPRCEKTIHTYTHTHTHTCSSGFYEARKRNKKRRAGSRAFFRRRSRGYRVLRIDRLILLSLNSIRLVHRGRAARVRLAGDPAESSPGKGGARAELRAAGKNRARYGEILCFRTRKRC